MHEYFNSTHFPSACYPVWAVVNFLSHISPSFSYPFLFVFSSPRSSSFCAVDGRDYDESLPWLICHGYDAMVAMVTFKRAPFYGIDAICYVLNTISNLCTWTPKIVVIPAYVLCFFVMGSIKGIGIRNRNIMKVAYVRNIGCFFKSRLPSFWNKRETQRFF